jgi:hypothetical protein
LKIHGRDADLRQIQAVGGFQPHYLRGQWDNIVRAINKREEVLEEIRIATLGPQRRTSHFDDVHELDNCPTESSGEEDEEDDESRLVGTTLT